MSCGNPHETPCTEVLDRVYGYLDGELDDLDCAKIRQHLDECGPCLREYGLEEAVKRVVQKHCGCDPAPGRTARQDSRPHHGKSAPLSSSLSKTGFGGRGGRGRPPELAESAPGPRSDLPGVWQLRHMCQP